MTGYLARRLVPAVALAAGTGAAVALLLSFLRFGPALVLANVPAVAVLALCGWALVPAIGVALGPAVLVGGVLALGRMRTDGELGAMASLGVARARLARIPFALAAAVAILAGIFALVLEPQAMRRIRRGLEDAVAIGVARSIEAAPRGRFSSPLPGTELFVSRDGIVLDANGTVLAARRGRAHADGRRVVLVLDDARVREGSPPRTLSAERLVLGVPTDSVASTSALGVELETSTARLAASTDRRARGALARRLAAPPRAAAFALWMIPLGLGPIGRKGRGLLGAAAVLGLGHVAFRLTESMGAAAMASAPAILAVGALLAARWRR